MKLATLAALLVLFCSLFADAQPPRRSGGPGRGNSFQGGGRFNRGGGGIFGTLLFREEAQQELGLSEEQLDKIRELSANARLTREELEPFSDRMRAAGDNEAEQEKIRAERDALTQKKAAAAEQQLATLIGEEKVSRLRQLNVQFEASRALTDNDALKQQLGLSEQQLTQIAELRDQQRDARRELGFRAPEAERQQFDREWNRKIFAVLSDEQQQKWKQQAGEIIVSNGVPGASAAPLPSDSAFGSASQAAGGSAVTEEEEDTTPPNIGDPLIRPDGEDGERIASFDASGASQTTADNSGSAPLTAPEKADSERKLTPLPRRDDVGLGSLPNAKVKKVSFNFRYAPWEDVLKLFAEIAGLTIDLTTTPPGTFNYVSDKEYTPLEALDVLNHYLLQKGYLLVRHDRFLHVLNIDQGIPPNLIPNVAVEDLPNRGRHEIMRIRVPLGGIEANVAAREVDLLLGPQGQVVPLTTSNSLLITDIGDNLRVIAQLLESVTTDEDPEEIIFQQFKIERISAAEAESMVEAQWGLETVARNVSSFIDRDRDRRGPTSSSASGEISITSDRRTNSLLVNAPRKEMKLIEDFIAAVDVGDEPYDPSKDPGLNNEPYLHVYTLKNADAREVTRTLSAMLPEGVVVNEDGRERTVHIFGNDEMQAKVAELIKQLDTSDSDIILDVIFLNRLDAVGAAAMLDSLFYIDGDRAPVIEPDSFGRRLNVRGTHEQINSIKMFLAKYGESGELDSSGRGNLRIFSAGNRDPAEMLQVLQQLWAQQPSPNRIRVSIPSQSNRVKGEYVPSKPPTEAGEEDSSPGAGRPARDSFREQMIRELERAITSSNTSAIDQALQETDEEVRQAIDNPEPILDFTRSSERDQTSAPEGNGGAAPEPEGTDLLDELDRRLGTDTEKKSNAESNGGEPDISLVLQGDKFIFSSEDEEALDQIEELLQAIGIAFPPQQDWTIFYLQSTDATEVAYTLEQLIPDSTVTATTSSSDGSLMGELTSGLLGIGESLADSSGLSSLTESSTSLRIIPETRLNALFVSGPNHLVAEVEEFLGYLDDSDLPPSLRDRLPKAIPVEYADVNEVFNIVSDVYKDYLSSGIPGGNNNRNNPLAALMGQAAGGSRSRGNNARPQLAKLTLGVDERTSQLIVSASDSLFREIEQLVKTIDQSAKDAKATVRLYRTNEVDPYLIQQTLKTLFPRVKVSSTATTRNQQQQDQGDAGRGDDNNRDRDRDRANDAARQQQEMLRRIQEIRQQQGGGNRGVGGFPGGGNRSNFGGGNRGGGGFGGDRGRGR